MTGIYVGLLHGDEVRLQTYFCKLCHDEEKGGSKNGFIVAFHLDWHDAVLLYEYWSTLTRLLEYF